MTSHFPHARMIVQMKVRLCVVLLKGASVKKILLSLGLALLGLTYYVAFIADTTPFNISFAVVALAPVVLVLALMRWTPWRQPGIISLGLTKIRRLLQQKQKITSWLVRQRQWWMDRRPGTRANDALMCSA